MKIPRPYKTAAARRQNTGFSLVEVMVLIGIISVLAALVLVARTALVGSSKERQTRLIMQTALGALTEYEASIGSRINHETGGTLDWNTLGGGTSYDDSQMGGTLDYIYTRPPTAPAVSIPNLAIERFVYAIRQNDAAERTFRNLNVDELFIDTDGDGRDEIVDAWGTPLIFASRIPGSAGTFSAIEARLEITRDPVFVSAGADQYFGDIITFNASNETIIRDENPDEDRDANGDGTGDSTEDGLDNIYSTDIQ